MTNPAEQFPNSGQARRITGDLQNTINLRIDDVTLSRLAALGNRERLNLSETVRVVLDVGLGHLET